MFLDGCHMIASSSTVSSLLVTPIQLRCFRCAALSRDEELVSDRAFLDADMSSNSFVKARLIARL